MFFAILNFTLSGAIGVVGILTLRKVSTPNEVIFASLPLLFALHQFTEGLAWLGVYHILAPRALDMVSSIFIFYAQGLLPFLVPLAIWLIEPAGFKKNIIAVLMVLGGLLAAYTLWGLSIMPTTVTVKNGILSYVNPLRDNRYDAAVYILTTCWALILFPSLTKTRWPSKYNLRWKLGGESGILPFPAQLLKSNFLSPLIT